MNIVTREPALTMGALQAFLALLTEFGLHLTPGQCAVILAASAAILSLVTRQMVTPVAKKDPP